MNTQEIFDKALLLSENERFELLEALQSSMAPTSMEIDREWTEVAKQRLADIDSGKVQTIPSDKVFAAIRQRFNDDN